MLPGNAFFFVILVWDSNGNWDFVWSPAAATPTAPPATITTLQRSWTFASPSFTTAMTATI